MRTGETGSSSNHHDLSEHIRFEVTGRAAHSRLTPLLPSHWRDVSPYASSTSSRETIEDTQPPHFLWENAPRHKTKAYRDQARCYSHLPNGTAILDDKWVLARLFDRHHATSSSAQMDNDESNPFLATLESHCFRGIRGYRSFCDEVEMWSIDHVVGSSGGQDRRRPDLLDDSVNTRTDLSSARSSPHNLWVVKDANSNGAGGIWVVDPRNARELADPRVTPLQEEHRYVAQRYAWPPLLYGGRKFHVRVYGLMTCDGRAFVHKRAFLHVANELFEYDHRSTSESGSGDKVFEPSQHITNCCANSHDAAKFAGEICADLDETSDDMKGACEHSVVPLAKFFPSIAASVSALAQATFPFLRGGEANNGMEYLGMDFILSYSHDGLPVAYLLEVNAPPSQDTATGLAQAEELHDDIIRDILSLWILPKVSGTATERRGGFKCVYNENDDAGTRTLQSQREFCVPSKASILNKIRWAIYERNVSRGLLRKTPLNMSYSTNGREASVPGTSFEDAITRFARSQFPYFSELSDSSTGEHSSSIPLGPQIFFENAGGAQAPNQVADAVYGSLCARDRCVLGVECMDSARRTLLTILGGSSNDHTLFLGANATSLLERLAKNYVESGLLTQNDEIVVCAENHLANVTPWLCAARVTGALVKWWDVVNDGSGSSRLEGVVTPRTKIVAFPHASNVLGQVHDVASLCSVVKKKSHGHAHVVVDGVAAVPHVPADVSVSNVDWYAVSCHKLFGPHLGALCARKNAVAQLLCDDDDEARARLFEKGTVSYEACAGVAGIGDYVYQLATCQLKPGQLQRSSSQRSYSNRCRNGRRLLCPANRITRKIVNESYRRIRCVEAPLVELLLSKLTACHNVRILELSIDSLARLPVVSFLHRHIPSARIVKFCRERGVVCRASTFLSTERLQHCLHFGPSADVPVRISLVHYNTRGEVRFFAETLESIQDWHTCKSNLN